MSRPLRLFPRPQGFTDRAEGGPPRLPGGYFARGAVEAAEVKNWSRREGLPSSEDASAMELRLVQRAEEATLYLDDPRRLSDEKYFITIEEVDGRLTAKIVYAEKRGLRHALTTLSALHRSGGFLPCEIEDYPSFAVRGVIEGFYGQPWRDEERIEVMRLLAAYKMNTYVYAPKDDPYHRDRWAEPYDDRSLERLDRLVAAAADCGLDFSYAIGPGLSFRYSDEGDFERLATKLEQIHGLGVRSYALLLDDIPPVLQFREDRARFPELVAAQIHLITRLEERLRGLDSSIRLAVCPTEYHGRGDEYGISRLGRSLPPWVDIYWTGPEICSRELATRDAALFGASTLHPPLYWDNYPVNDLEMADELHIGPYRGRDRDLWRFSRGIIANGMEHCEASKIPLITIACYAWNPEAYHDEVAHGEAIRTVAGERDAEAFALFADNVRSSCLAERDSPRLAAALERFRLELLSGSPEEAFAGFEADLAPFRAVSEQLAAGLENRRLEGEISPWLTKYREGIDLLRAAVVALRCGSGAVELEARYQSYLKEPHRVFGDVLYPAVAQILERVRAEGGEGKR